MVVSLWENGKYRPSTEHAIALAKVFDVTVDELWGPHEETVVSSACAAEGQ